MTLSLQVLADNRPALLLAEVAAWLHDDFKHTDGHIHQYVASAPVPSGRQDAEDLVPLTQFALLGRSLQFSGVKKRRRDDFVDGYLNRCHYAAHVEKRDGDGDGEQTYPAYLSSPFGYERDTIPGGLSSDLRNRISWSKIATSPFTASERSALREQIAHLFSRVGGDTRRPANEITLWEWGHTVGAPYQAVLVGALLGHQPANRDLRWRLLSVRMDGPAFYGHVARLPDLLARRQLLTDALDRVRDLLEVRYPVGSEVYRDEIGSVFVVPDLAALLEAEDNAGQTLRALMASEFNVAGEVVPEITLDSTAWWGQDPDRAGNDEIPPIDRLLARIPASCAEIETVAAAWQGRTADVCPVCGLRPQGPGPKAQSRNVCDTCEQRRASRAREWTQHFDTTIWTDEVADANGRLALIVGRFDLEHWLDGTMVQTLTVTEPQAGQVVAKSPSFARIRRIWETTRTFWQEAQQDILNTLTDDRRRLKITIANPSNLNLADNQVYELDLGNMWMSMLWDGAHLISTDNLSYIASQLEVPTDKRATPSDAALQVGIWLDNRKNERQFRLCADDDRRKRFDVAVSDVDYQDTAYATAIPILAEPRTFMALVPADRALEVVKAIKSKYEREISKVRNRLPLTLGVVYFGRRTPLAAALDAGRRVLNRKQDAPSQWQVAGAQTASDGWASLALQNGEREITVRVKTVMGDSKTPDTWYPYWRVEGKPTGRNHWFVGPDGEHWVHVCDLRQGDRVAFTPSTFDFEYLEATARRFEVSYENGQRRGKDKAQRPYLLEELDRIEQAWAEISRLSISQIKMIESLIEGKRRDWLATGTLEGQQTFRQFVQDVLREAKIHSEALERAATSGTLADALELHLTIAKEGETKEAN